MSERVKYILERALSEAWEQYPGCKKLVPESLVREALAALEAEER